MGPEVLRDVTFSIEPNSFQFLTGPSGAGKTTLLRLIFMSLRPTRGLISLSARTCRASPSDDAHRAAPPHRHRVPGFPPARPPDHLGERRPAVARAGQGGGELSRGGDRAVALGRPRRPHARAAAGSLRRREAARGDRPRADRAARASARRRADRQRRPVARAPPAAPVHRAQPARHLGGHRHPRLRPDGSARRAAASCSATAGCISTSEPCDRTPHPRRPRRRQRAAPSAAAGRARSRNAPLVPVDSAGGQRARRRHRDHDLPRRALRRRRRAGRASSRRMAIRRSRAR